MEKNPIQKEFGEIQTIDNRIRIKKFGTNEQIGQIILAEETKPVRHYLAHWLWVASPEQGKGFASQLLSEVERISKQSRCPVILIDGIKPHKNPEAFGMYKRRAGWTEIPNARGAKSVYVYGARDGKAESALTEFYSGRHGF